MRRSLLPVSLAAALLLGACRSNPAAPGFDAEHSDARAIEIADQVMEALGGRRAWDRTRFLSWNFFGRRTLGWDKSTGEFRLDEPESCVRMNLETGIGRAWRKGEPVSAPDELAKALSRARSIWINDSYWLLMPYKLKDSGVTLRYAGERALPDGRAADVLALSFASVGDTPQNRYEVWVDQRTRLVAQWAYFAQATDAEPKMVTPWTDWKPYGSILLSSGRGEKRELAHIQVLDAPPAGFDDPPPRP